MNSIYGSVIKKRLSLQNNLLKDEEKNKIYLEKQSEENCVLIKSIKENLEELRKLRGERQLFQEKISSEKRKNLELFIKFEKIFEENKNLKVEINRLNMENLAKEKLLKEKSLQEIISNKRKHIEAILIE